MIARDIVVFPQPDSPTRPTRLPLVDREGHVVHGVDARHLAVDDEALLDREEDLQVLDLDERPRRSSTAPRAALRLDAHAASTP